MLSSNIVVVYLNYRHIVSPENSTHHHNLDIRRYLRLKCMSLQKILQISKKKFLQIFTN